MFKIFKNSVKKVYAMSTEETRPIFPFLHRLRERIRERIFGTPVSEKETIIDIDQPFTEIIDKSGNIGIEISTIGDYKIVKHSDSYYLLVTDGEVKLFFNGNEVGVLKEDNVELYLTPTKGVEIKLNHGSTISISTFGKVRESRRIMKIISKEGESDVSKMAKAKIYKISIYVEGEVKPLEKHETKSEVASSPKVEFKVEVKPSEEKKEVKEEKSESRESEKCKCE